MKTNIVGVLVILLVAAGCVSSQVSVRIDGAPAGWKTTGTRLKYHISSMRSRNPGLARMLQEAGGVNATMQSGWTCTPAQIRKLERLYPSVFEEDGIPVDVDIEVATENEASLAKLPYGLLCGCSLCILPYYSGWSETSIYRLKISSSSRPQSFSLTRKYEGSWSLVGLNNLVPFSPLENFDFKYQNSDASGAERVSQLIVQAIVSALCASEGRSSAPASRKIGQMIGD